jgi:L-ascorbate metabolism protein UlaG (beta-lactamase superfamily)
MRFRHVLPSALVAAAALLVARASAGLPTALGARAAHLRGVAQRAADAGSTHATGGLFHNTLPEAVTNAWALLPVLRALLTRGPEGRPAGPVPLLADAPPDVAGALAVTWYGHSSVLLEVDGHRVLADPVWGDRISPSPVFGPRRLHPTPVPLPALPPVVAVLISHDHYDHLDLPTVRALLDAGEAPFVVPLGVGAHLRRWGVPEARVVELDWGGSTTVGPLTVTCTEARHFSGRNLRRNTTLWSSWVVAGPRNRVFFGGDTGYGPAFADIGRRHGPFDLTVLPIGAYSDRWPLIHLDPEQAVAAHGDLQGGSPAGHGVLLPVHWATFNLGFHPWGEPIRRLLAAAGRAGVRVALPRPGGRVDATGSLPSTHWWSGLC